MNELKNYLPRIRKDIARFLRTTPKNKRYKNAFRYLVALINMSSPKVIYDAASLMKSMMNLQDYTEEFDNHIEGWKDILIHEPPVDTPLLVSVCRRKKDMLVYEDPRVDHYDIRKGRFYCENHLKAVTHWQEILEMREDIPIKDIDKKLIRTRFKSKV